MLKIYVENICVKYLQSSDLYKSWVDFLKSQTPNDNIYLFVHT